MSKSLDPDQALHVVMPDLQGPKIVITCVKIVTGNVPMPVIFFLIVLLNKVWHFKQLILIIT